MCIRDRASRCRPETDDAFASDSQSRNENRTLEKGSTREAGGPSPKYQKGYRIRKRHPGFGTGQGQNRTRQGGEGRQGGTARDQTPNGGSKRPTREAHIQYAKSRPKQGGTARRREKSSSDQGRDANGQNDRNGPCQGGTNAEAGAEFQGIRESADKFRPGEGKGHTSET